MVNKEKGEFGSCTRLIDGLRDLQRKRIKAERASESRRSLPAGSSRARVTTANARWATACEGAERARREVTKCIAELLEEFGLSYTAKTVRDALPPEFRT